MPREYQFVYEDPGRDYRSHSSREHRSRSDYRRNDSRYYDSRDEETDRGSRCDGRKSTWHGFSTPDARHDYDSWQVEYRRGRHDPFNARSEDPTAVRGRGRETRLLRTPTNPRYLYNAPPYHDMPYMTSSQAEYAANEVPGTRIFRQDGWETRDRKLVQLRRHEAEAIEDGYRRSLPRYKERERELHGRWH